MFSKGGNIPNADRMYLDADRMYPDVDRMCPDADRMCPDADRRCPDADRMYPDADRSCLNADRRCLIYKVGAESGAASHAPPSQLSPGGDRADIWGEGERKRFSVQLGALKREEGEKNRSDWLCEISS